MTKQNKRMKEKKKQEVTSQVVKRMKMEIIFDKHENGYSTPVNYIQTYILINN